MFLVESRRGDRPDAGLPPYTAFLPHLITGPIMRPRNIMPQLLAPSRIEPRVDHLTEGNYYMPARLAKKLVLPDMFARFADIGFNAVARGAALTFVEASYAAASYALQIYFRLPRLF